MSNSLKELSFFQNKRPHDEGRSPEQITVSSEERSIGKRFSQVKHLFAKNDEKIRFFFRFKKVLLKSPSFRGFLRFKGHDYDLNTNIETDIGPVIDQRDAAAIIKARKNQGYEPS